MAPVAIKELTLCHHEGFQDNLWNISKFMFAKRDLFTLKTAPQKIFKILNFKDIFGVKDSNTPAPQSVVQKGSEWSGPGLALWKATSRNETNRLRPLSGRPCEPPSPPPHPTFLVGSLKKLPLPARARKSRILGN